MGNNTDDQANNARLIRELRKIPPEKRTARFVCVIAAARDGQTLNIFRGQAEGVLLDSPRGSDGFGYDPLFYFPSIQKTFAELTQKKKPNTATVAQPSASVSSTGTRHWYLTKN